MKHCSICKKYNIETDDCDLCEFEVDKDKFFSKSDFDILDLNEDDGWEYLQILDRLYAMNIECLFADIWYDNNLAFLVGCKGKSSEVANVLGVHEEVVYDDFEHGLMILNLFQEKFIRGLLNAKNNNNGEV